MYSVVLYLTAAIVILPAILLLSGRGAFLIAGYNTASPAQKATVDEKKLCRVTGIGLLVCGLPILIMAVLGENIPSGFIPVFIGVILLDVILMVVISNSRYCRIPSVPPIPEAERQKSRRITRLVLGITAVLTLPICFILFTGSITPEYGEDAVLIRASWWPDLTLRYEDISAIELREEAVPGTRMGGMGSARLLLGRFRNDEFGHYTRYTCTGSTICLVLTEGGKTVVLSGADDPATRAMYQELCRRTGLS